LVVQRLEFSPDVSRVLEQVETNSGGYSRVFGVKLFNGVKADLVGRTVQPEIQDGGRKTEVLISQATYETKKEFQRLLQ
jgi:hypothetical protein